MVKVDNEKGSASLIFLMFVVLAILFSALVVDFGLAHVGRQQLRTVAEAASLAGALSAELVVEAEYNEETGEIDYQYLPNIVPEKAMQSAAAVINEYINNGGLMKDINIEEIDYQPIEEDGYYMRYAVTLKGTQKTPFSIVWTDEGRSFEITRSSEAKLELLLGQ